MLTLFSLVYPFLAHSSISYPEVVGVVFFTGIGNVIMFFFQGKYKILLIEIYTKGVENINYSDTRLALLFSVIALLTAMRKPMLMTISYAGHFKLTTPQMVAETIINLTVSLIAVRFLGIYGVLLGSVAALLYRTTDVIIYANKRILLRSFRKTLLIYAVCFVDTVLIQAVFFGSQALVFGDFRKEGVFLLKRIVKKNN